MTVWQWKKMNALPMKRLDPMKSKITCSRSGPTADQPSQQMTVQTVWIGCWSWRQKRKQANLLVLALQRSFANVSTKKLSDDKYKEKAAQKNSNVSISSSRKWILKYGCQCCLVPEQLMRSTRIFRVHWFKGLYPLIKLTNMMARQVAEKQPLFIFIYWTTIKHNYRLLISMGKTIIIVSRKRLKALTCKAMDSTSSCKSYYIYKCTELKIQQN